MFTWYTVATGIVVLSLAYYNYRRTSDAFHPAVLVSPLFFYMYCAWPLVLNLHGGLYRFFSPSSLEYVSLVYLLSITCFYVGLSRRGHGKQQGASIDIFDIRIEERTRKQIANLSVFLGVLAVGAYLYKISNVGGFEEAYSHPKGGGHVSSGYISESVLFSFPAVLLYAISRKEGKVSAIDFIAVLIMMSPHLIQGTLGGRRGPIFLGLATLFVSWFIAKRERPKMATTIVGVGLCGLAVLFVWSHRQDVYLGSGGQVEVERVWEKVVPEGQVSQGNTYVAGAATVEMAKRLHFYYWGYRYFVTLFIRPIPKQIWPTKYEDMGADWLLHYGENVRDQRYRNTVGFVPLAGSAVGYVADAYLEFSWGVLLFSYLLGRVFHAAWMRHVRQGGLWSVLYLVMIVLSIYLAAQSVTAWAYRLIFIGGLTFLSWKYWINAKGGDARVTES